MTDTQKTSETAATLWDTRVVAQILMHFTNRTFNEHRLHNSQQLDRLGLETTATRPYIDKIG